MNIQGSLSYEELKILYEAVQSLFLSLGVKKVLGQVGQAAAQLVRAEASFIELLSDYRECMRIV